MDAFDLTSTYLHLGEGPDLTILPVTDDFWPTISERAELQRGRLVTSFAETADWSTWEMHPAGDEVILCTEGRMVFHLDDGSDVSTVDVPAPGCIVVPTGVWHTADVPERSRIVVITWGEGTRHHPRAVG